MRSNSASQLSPAGEVSVEEFVGWLEEDGGSVPDSYGR